MTNCEHSTAANPTTATDGNPSPVTTMHHQPPTDTPAADATRAQAESANPFPPCLNRQQAAAWLGISLRHLAELEADRRARLPRAKLGRRVVYQQRDLSRWLTERAGR